MEENRVGAWSATQKATLYGTTNIGGLAGGGMFLKLDPHGHESVLYHFGTFGFLNTGAEPSGLIQDEAGDLFHNGFRSGYPSGTVSKVDLKGTAPFCTPLREALTERSQWQAWLRTGPATSRARLTKTT